MAHKYETQLAGLVEQLKSIDPTLPPEMANIQNRVREALKREMGFINGIRGVYEGLEVTKKDVTPLTHIMGVPIKGHVPITKEDIQPTDDEKQNFMQLFQPLWDKFMVTPDEELLGYAKMQGSLLRACGKKAGMQDYDTAKLNTAYIKAVKQLIDLKNKTAEAVLSIQNDTAKLNA
jgi:hypothetical protein